MIRGCDVHSETSTKTTLSIAIDLQWSSKIDGSWEGNDHGPRVI